jgi:hypothetical protein
VAGVDQRIALAVRDNARWCHRVAVSHGIAARIDDDAWVSPARTPPGYPDAVTLRPDLDAAALLARIDTGPGSSVKDSFAALDLAGARFEALFEASWIWRPAGGASRAEVPAWAPVRTAADLTAWAVAHGGGSTFRPVLVGDPTVVILARRTSDGHLTGGAIASVEDDAVGISNVFALEGAFGDAFAGATEAIARRFPDRPIVGYLGSSRLDAALAAGFEPTGPLRVWLRPAILAP